MDGYCNICCLPSKLTWDHVPPQGSTTLRRAETNSLIDIFRKTSDGQRAKYHLQEGKELPKTRGRITQNGVKFKTLCSVCNNKLLGARYDREIKHISKVARALIRTALGGTLILPEQS